jgi:AraC-like DNA-binding protein
MALLLDTADFPPDKRAEAVAELMRFSSSVPTLVTYNCPDEVSARFEYFVLGETRLLKSQNSTQRLIRTPAQLKGVDPELLSVSLKRSGTGAITQGPTRALHSGDLFVTAMWQPLEFFDSGGQNSAFYFPLGRLGLSPDYAARASQAIQASPLASLLQRHLHMVSRNAGALSQGVAAAMIGQATIDLVRAALIAAVDEDPGGREGWDQDLTAVVKSYIAQHLADPDLSADRIAKAMFISVRQLYKLWESEPRPLGQWMLERRLDAARHDLTSPHGHGQTIAAIARRWGFADSKHFSRRFRLAYGMSPREWRQATVQWQPTGHGDDRGS